MNSFEQMEAVIAQRRAEPQEGSYTCYLFEKGIDKILKKVGEECAETIIAAKNGDKTELVGEINDVFYHMMVMMNECGWISKRPYRATKMAILPSSAQTAMRI